MGGGQGGNRSSPLSPLVPPLVRPTKNRLFAPGQQGGESEGSDVWESSAQGGEVEEVGSEELRAGASPFNLLFFFIPLKPRVE